MACKRKLLKENGKQTIVEVVVEKGVEEEAKRHKEKGEELSYADKGEIRRDIQNGLFNLGYDPRDN